ncbi:MAG: protein kinase, partial [Acidobacteriota bacterium]
DAYRNAKDFTAAAAAYETASEHLAAARCYRENNDPKAARRSLKEVASDHADYGLASLMLIDLLIEEGSFDGALYRLRELETAVTAMDEETRARVPDVDLRYWRGRIQEAKGEHAQAAVAYEQVISMSGDARDASRRLGEMRKWLHESQRLGGTARRGRHASGAHAPVAAGAAHSAGPSDETSTGEIQLAALAAAAQLPFVRGEAIEPPWWPDCTLQRAIDQRTNQPVEVLSLPLPSGVVWDAFERIRPGVRALDHPAILRLQEVVLADGRAHFAFSPFGGTPLGERLNGPRRPGAGQVLKMLMELADAIATAHHLGVQHGWLSPLTVLIDDDDRIRLVGFGMRDLVPADSTTLIAYLAPEVRDGLPLGPAADLYGLGLLGIELLNAHLPLDWSESASINPGDVFWPEEFDDVVPDAVRTVLLRCLARNPMARPSSADLKLALAAIGLVEGQVLMDRFEIRDELGRGGMSRVYRAFDRNLHDEVAIKTLLSPSGAHSEDAERLLREVQICRKISHPNVVRVHDMGYFPGGIFISMELLDGPGLDTIIKRKAPLPLAYTQRVLREVAEALGEAHRLNIVHRDLKPGNVMIADGRAKVMDFGIARIDDGNSNHLTRTGEVIGSPLYMAPEQIQGRPLDGTCDLYALGVIAFTMLAGREPFLGDSATEVVLKHINEKPPEIRSFRPDLPRSWVDMIARLLAKRPAKRYPSAAALIEALDRLPTEAF